MSKKGQKVTLLSIPRIKTFKSRPPVVCGKFLLSDSYHKKDPLIIPESELYETLYEIYPQACFIELFQWILFFEKNSYLIDSKKLALAYNFYWGDHETELKKSFSMWPQEFIHWSISKKAHSGDLRPINLYSQMNPKLQTSFWFLLESFDKAQLSLSEGKKILEWTIDLLSRGESIDTLAFKKKEASSSQSSVNFSHKKDWIKHLYKLRYPYSSQEDNEKIKFIRSTAWPSGVQVQFIRKGDQSGFEYRAFISSVNSKVQDNLSKSIKKIEKFISHQ